MKALDIGHFLDKEGKKKIGALQRKTSSYSYANNHQIANGGKCYFLQNESYTYKPKDTKIMSWHMFSFGLALLYS